MNLTKTELKEMIKESVKNVLNETSRRQKAQQAITNNAANIRKLQFNLCDIIFIRVDKKI